MNTGIKLKITEVIFFIILIFSISSCSKKTNDEPISKKGEQQPEMTQVKEDDFNESNEDLLNVDFKNFYDELSSKGEWIEVNGKEIGIEIDKGTASGDYNLQKQILSYLTGVNEAYADVNEGMVFVWKPSLELAVPVPAVEPTVYIPYSNGQWVNTDNGWYFTAPTPAEEIVHHYGRWTYTEDNGWLWVPGRVWSPAWVDWKISDNLIAWAPIPPAVYVVNNAIPFPVIDEDRYIVVEKNYFIEPAVYKYFYKENKNKIMIKEMKRSDGIMVINHTIINKGPVVTDIEYFTKKKIEVVKINRVLNFNDVRYSSGRINTYVPVFNRVHVNEKVKKPVTHPKSFVRFEETKNFKKNESAASDNKDRQGKDMEEKSRNNDKEKNLTKENKKNEDMDRGRKNNENNNGKNNEHIKKNNKDNSDEKNKGNDMNKENKRDGDGNSKGNNKNNGNGKNKK